MNIKKLLAIVVVTATLLTLALPMHAHSKAATENLDYLINSSATIGTCGFSLSVMGDGSFSYGEGEDAEVTVFGSRVPDATVTPAMEPYPVSLHKYSSNGLDYTVEQFVLQGEAADFVYSVMKVKNTTDVSVAFPVVEGTEPLGDTPEEIKPGNESTTEYAVMVNVHNSNTEADSSTEDTSDPALDSTITDAPQSISLPADSYKQAKEQMTDMWDEILDNAITFEGFSNKYSENTVLYKKEIIKYCISSKHDDPALIALTSKEWADEIFPESTDLYACALALLKTKNENKALLTLDKLTKLADQYKIDTKSLPYPTLEENLDALLSLQSYSCILRTLESKDRSLTKKADNIDKSVALLSKNIAKAIEKTEELLPCDWEAATTDGSYPIILNGDGYGSAAALCSWYTKSAPFTCSISKELVYLSKDAFAYYDTPDGATSSILSLFCERSDGTVIIGRGSPYSLLSDNEKITVNNIPLSTGGTAKLKISVTKSSVKVSLSGPISAPVQIQFPAFADNIEFASVGYDDETGVITAPTGTSSVTVRLKNSPAELEKDRTASAALENAIFNAHNKNTGKKTTVSQEQFDKALKTAEKAHSSTAAKKEEATKALVAATNSLSAMTAGYSHSIPATGIDVGQIKHNEILQKFSLPETGTIDSVFVRGEYHEGISCAVYTLRGDNYTTDELGAECYGEEYEDGILFELDFDAEGGETYVLCVFSEEQDVCLTLENTTGETAYTRDLGEVTVYNKASLSLDFSVSQVNREDLDSFYYSCLEADTSRYTKESRKALDKKLSAAKKLLCTPSVTEEEYEKVYEDLKDAYEGLETYASEDKIEQAPLVGIILIAIVVVLLIITLFASLAARKRMNSDILP